MLISLLAMFEMAFSDGIRATVSDTPVVLEGPSTLELGLIGGGIIAVYAVATRAIGRRRARLLGDGIGNEIAVEAPQATVAVDALEEQGSSRGAA